MIASCVEDGTPAVFIETWIHGNLVTVKTKQNKTVEGWQDGPTGRDAHCQVSWPEFNSWNPQGRRREPISSRLLTYTWQPWNPSYPQLHIQKKNEVNFKNSNLILLPIEIMSILFDFPFLSKAIREMGKKINTKLVKIEVNSLLNCCLFSIIFASLTICWRHKERFAHDHNLWAPYGSFAPLLLCRTEIRSF